MHGDNVARTWPLGHCFRSDPIHYVIPCITEQATSKCYLLDEYLSELYFLIIISDFNHTRKKFTTMKKQLHKQKEHRLK